MNPVSALGVAAATLQFLDASIKAYNALQQIRSSAESSTERNKQLEDNIRAAENLRCNPSSTSAPSGTTDPVTELTAKCASKANELLNLLEYVRGSGEDISSMRVAFRVFKKGKRIEKLHSSLAGDRVTLDQMISQKLFNEFANLSSSVQKLIGDLVEQRKAQEVNHAILAGKLDSVHHNMQLRFSEADRMMMREKVLESLFFPEIDQRRSEIKEPAPDTLEWLFESDTQSSDRSRSQRSWSNVRQWLREDTSMYWISGKAGSGKSTLMAHIVDDKRTLHDLDIWRDGHELRILSFFFWRAGTPLQNSVLGLLRSLLYQLCRLQPSIVDNVLAQLSSPIGIIPTWTERSLLNHITKAIQFSTGFRFCVFIDGLDEYTGPYNDLIDNINQLQSFGNLKICVSSRPELELVNKLQGLKQLRLQDLNRDDIKHFVQKSLSKTQLGQQERTNLAEEVAYRAEGVFLWASLVTQSLLKGYMAGDGQDIIQRRLDSLPGDMEQLFKRMLMDVDVVHRESLALYVQLMMVQREMPPRYPTEIPMIATMQLCRRIDSYEEFTNECENTELRITTRSAGLLEVQDSSKDIGNEEKRDWERCTTKFISNKPRFIMLAGGLDRYRCAENEPYPTMLKYETRTMSWIHRSAFEFFSNLSEKIPSFESGLSREALLRKISESQISYLLAAPSYVVNDYPRMSQRLLRCLDFISRWHDEYPTTASALLDNLSSIYAQVKLDELSSIPVAGDCTTETIFWSECIATRNWPYMLSRIGCISNRTTSRSLIAHLLVLSVAFINRHIDRSNLVSIIDSLAETLLHLTVQRQETSSALQTTAYKCISLAEEPARDSYGPVFWHDFVCASWRDGLHTLLIMTRLIFLVGRLQFFMLQSEIEDSFMPLLAEKLLEPLSTVMEITDLYVAPDFGLKRICVQIPATAWVRFCRSAFLGKNCDDGYIASHILAAQVLGAVKILCVPSFKKRQKILSQRTPLQINSGKPWKPAMQLQESQFIFIHPSTTTSCQLLDLFKCLLLFSDSIKFRMIPNANKQREEIYRLLLREIKSAEQGLDGGQQLVAAACVRTALLDPDIEEIA